MPGLVPGIYVFVEAYFTPQEDVGAHGSSPWAEGPRVKPGHGGCLLPFQALGDGVGAASASIRAWM